MREITAEALRYLGFGQKQPDNTTLTLLRRAAQELAATVQERIIFLMLPLTMEDSCVFAGNARFESAKLAAHLSASERCVLLCATLGVGVDRLLARYSAREMGYAAVLNAAASAWIEAFLDEWQQGFLLEHPEFSAVSRFSPGYGDWDIADQPKILNLLSAWRIGVTATQSHMLVPVKSVTAILGLRSGECSGENPSSGCANCDKTECVFRKESV